MHPPFFPPVFFLLLRLPSSFLPIQTQQGANPLYSDDDNDVEISEYVQNRLRMIQQNDALLNRLGLQKAIRKTSRQGKTKSNRGPRPITLKHVSSGEVQNLPTVSAAMKVLKISGYYGATGFYKLLENSEPYKDWHITNTENSSAGTERSTT